jgi:hypothetical protein
MAGPSKLTLLLLSVLNVIMRPHTDLFFPVSNTDNSTQGDQRKNVQFPVKHETKNM